MIKKVAHIATTGIASTPHVEDAKQLRDQAQELLNRAEAIDREQRRAVNEARNAAHAAKRARLRADCASEYSLTGSPVEPLIWDKAWKHGHSPGEDDVRYWYEEFWSIYEATRKALTK